MPRTWPWRAIAAMLSRVRIFRRSIRPRARSLHYSTPGVIYGTLTLSLNEGVIQGTTDIGRATARLLNMNAFYRVQLRIETGDSVR